MRFKSELMRLLPGKHLHFLRQFSLLQQNLTFESFYSFCLAFPWKSLAFGVLSHVLSKPKVHSHRMWWCPWLQGHMVTFPWASLLVSLASSSSLRKTKFRVRITLVAPSASWEVELSPGQGQSVQTLFMACVYP